MYFIAILSFFTLLNDFLTIFVFGIPSLFFIRYLVIHLYRERRSFKNNLKENLESSECIVRRYEIAKAKYSIMLALCILELFIISSIPIPDVIYEVSSDINDTDTARTRNFPYNRCMSDPIVYSICNKEYGKVMYIVCVSGFLALIFLSRSLCLTLNNVYTERKQITNFKVWFPMFAFEVVVINILALFQQTLPFQMIIFITLFFFKYYLLVREMKILNHSIVLRHFELRRDYPNSIATLKSCNDIKYFKITSKFTLTYIFFMIVTFIIWVPIESLLTFAFNYPCYLHYFYGIGEEYNHMVISPYTARYIYRIFHVLQNISHLIANLTVISLYVILITHFIVSLHKRRSSAYGLQRPQLITALLDTNTKCYITKNNIM